MTNKKRCGDRTIVEIHDEALDRLAADYGTEPGDYRSLLLHVAADRVSGFPRFKLEQGKYGAVVPDNKGGRKTYWTPEKLDELTADVGRIKKEHRFTTDDEALRQLAQSARNPKRDPDKRHKTLKNALARARTIQRDTNRLLAKADRLLACWLRLNPEN